MASTRNSFVPLWGIIEGLVGGLKLLGEKKPPQRDVDDSYARAQPEADTFAAPGWNCFSGSNWEINSGSRPEQHLDSLTSEQIELLLGEIYRRSGFEVQLSVARGAIDEEDLTLSRSGERILVRCRDWGVKRVGVEKIDEFCGAMTARQANSGIFVTSGKLTRDARTAAKGKPLQLIEQEGLEEAVDAVTLSGENLLAFGGWLDAFLDAAHFLDPTCPVCCSSMVLQPVGGCAADQWNCTMDPLCQGTRQARTSVANAIASRDAEFVNF